MLPRQLLFSGQFLADFYGKKKKRQLYISTTDITNKKLRETESLRLLRQETRIGLRQIYGKLDFLVFRPRKRNKEQGIAYD